MSGLWFLSNALEQHATASDGRLWVASSFLDTMRNSSPLLSERVLIVLLKYYWSGPLQDVLISAQPSPLPLAARVNGTHDNTTTRQHDNIPGPKVSTLGGEMQQLKGDWKWHGGNLGNDGMIYGIPCNANSVVKVNPRTSEVTTIGGPWLVTSTVRG